MSQRNKENRHVVQAKKKAKHLHALLKVRIPDCSLGECLDIYSKIQGAKDWNAFRADLNKMVDIEDIGSHICTSTDQNSRAFIPNDLRLFMSENLKFKLWSLRYLVSVTGLRRHEALELSFSGLSSEKIPMRNIAR